MRRRDLLLGVVGAAMGCGPPKTPLAHLTGKAWVTGAYEHYGSAYQNVQAQAEAQSFEAYAVLAQKGVGALDALQLREVPFHIRVGQTGDTFQVHRDVPERLTFKADMDEAARERATATWERAREHIHTDYAEIQRLNWALTRLLEQLQRIRHAIDAARVEQFRLTKQLSEIEVGELPFELPRDVTPAAYAQVLLLLAERLDDDRERLHTVETQILATGLVARSADDGSASLATNLRKVLLAIVKDAESSSVRANAYPAGDEQALYISKGRKVVVGISKSDEYIKWLEDERDAWLEQLGSVLTVVDAMTGVPVSAAYNKAVTIFKGDADYLDYLQLVSSFSPSPELRQALDTAVEMTTTARDVYAKGKGVVEGDTSEALGALLNTGTQAARKQADKQLAFFADKADLDAVTEQLDQTEVMRAALPIP